MTAVVTAAAATTTAAAATATVTGAIKQAVDEQEKQVVTIRN